MIDYIKRLFSPSDDATWQKCRLAEARSLATQHARDAVEAEEAAQWATVQAHHHRNMAAMYEARVQCLTNAE